VWKRDVSVGFTGFTAAMTLFAMAHYLAMPRFGIAAFLVFSAATFLVSVVSYAVAVAKPSSPLGSASAQAQVVAVSSPATSR
jgi:hypothetical protein